MICMHLCVYILAIIFLCIFHPHSIDGSSDGLHLQAFVYQSFWILHEYIFLVGASLFMVIFAQLSSKQWPWPYNFRLNNLKYLHRNIYWVGSWQTTYKLNIQYIFRLGFLFLVRMNFIEIYAEKRIPIWWILSTKQNQQ